MVAVVTAAGFALGGAVFAPSVSAQTPDPVADCAGTISTSVATSALPGGEWSVTDGCLPADSFFEYTDGEIQAKVAVSKVTYDDGHTGRVAAGVLTLGSGTGLSIVGVEDAATGIIKWSAVLGDYTADGDTVGVSGDGVALFPTEKSAVSVSITGTGTDVKPILEAGGTTTTAPPAVGNETPADPGDPSIDGSLPTPGSDGTETPSDPVGTVPPAPAPPATTGDPGTSGAPDSGPPTTVPAGSAPGSNPASPTQP